jgi:hypothetical protein
MKDLLVVSARCPFCKKKFKQNAFADRSAIESAVVDVRELIEKRVAVEIAAAMGDHVNLEHPSKHEDFEIDVHTLWMEHVEKKKEKKELLN